MLTRFVSDKIYAGFNIEYPFDENIKMENIPLNIDGNLNYNVIPSLDNAKDIKTNNYTVTLLSRNDNLNKFLEFKKEGDFENNLCYVYSNSSPNFDSNAVFWKNRDEFLTSETEIQNLNRSNIFEIDFLDENKCKINHEKDNLKFVLAYSLSMSALRFVPLTATNISNYTTEFNYILNDTKIIFYVQTEMGNYPIKKRNDNLLISYVSSFGDESVFYIQKRKELGDLKNNNNWISYENKFNQNSLDKDENRSHFDITNNHLFTATTNSIVSSLPVNVLTLKNQLNQENDQSRGNVFLNETETTLKEYESIFSGGDRQFGYDKLNLGYTSYSNPFKFKSGKTTYFHVPHDIYPYERLNVNSSKLAEAGAIGGNCPLNSDKIWKKLKDYRNSSPYSTPSEENTGQWLCSWLSAGNPNTRPVWVDRYYKPSKTTPYVALSAIATEIIYKDSFNCLDLKNDISDVKSSLTFERGCYYAYMHLGSNDYENLIAESLSAKIFHTDLDSYQNTNFLKLEQFANEYEFDGTKFGFIDSNTKFENNVATFSLFLEKDKWEVPSGNMLFGNYINKGFGFFNYILNTPYVLVKENKNTLAILNNNFVKIDSFSTENITLSSIAGISRRNGFENIHVITKDFKLVEFDLRGTIVDSNSAVSDVLSLGPTDEIISVTNDENYFYVATSNGIAKIDLNTNNVSEVNADKEIFTSEPFELLVDDNEILYKVYGKQPIIRNDNVYYFYEDEIKCYYNSTDTLSTFLTFDQNIDCFGITKENEMDVISKNILYTYEGQNLTSTQPLCSLDTYSLSAIQISYCEKFEYGNLVKLKNIFCKNDNSSYVIQIDENKKQTTKKLGLNYDIVQNNLDITNYNHNVQCLSSKFDEKTYHFKVKLLNKVNLEDYFDIVFKINSDDLATGYRHFVFSIDCYNGKADFYLDGQLYERINFDARKYILSETFKDRIFYGNNPFFNGIPAFKYFKDAKDFTYSNLKLKENFIINKSLDRFETLYFYAKVNPPDDLKYNMPSGTRSFIDSIDKFFNFNIPMFKTGCFKLNILNSGIYNETTKKNLENYIQTNIKEYLPIYGELIGTEWIENKISNPIALENYNLSNTLTRLI